MGYLQRRGENNYTLRAYRGRINGMRRYENRPFQGSVEEALAALTEFQDEDSAAQPRQPLQQWVYAIADGDPPTLIKIGRAIDVAQRMKELATGSPVPLILLGQWQPANIYDSEWYLHYKYAAVRQHGEWFSATAELVAEIARRCTST